MGIIHKTKKEFLEHFNKLKKQLKEKEEEENHFYNKDGSKKYN